MSPVPPAPDVVANTLAMFAGVDHARYERLDAVDGAEQVDSGVQLPSSWVGVGARRPGRPGRRHMVEHQHMGRTEAVVRSVRERNHSRVVAHVGLHCECVGVRARAIRPRVFGAVTVEVGQHHPAAERSQVATRSRCPSGSRYR